jgi:hypothetical protein
MGGVYRINPLEPKCWDDGSGPEDSTAKITGCTNRGRFAPEQGQLSSSIIRLAPLVDITIF